MVSYLRKTFNNHHLHEPILLMSLTDDPLEQWRICMGLASGVGGGGGPAADVTYVARNIVMTFLGPRMKWNYKCSLSKD